MKKEIKIDCTIKERKGNHYVKVDEIKNAKVEDIYNILQFKYLGKRNKIKTLIERIKEVGDIAEKEIEEILGINQ